MQNCGEHVQTRTGLDLAAEVIMVTPQKVVSHSVVNLFLANELRDRLTSPMSRTGQGIILWESSGLGTGLMLSLFVLWD